MALAGAAAGERCRLSAEVARDGKRGPAACGAVPRDPPPALLLPLAIAIAGAVRFLSPCASGRYSVFSEWLGLAGRVDSGNWF